MKIPFMYFCKINHSYGETLTFTTPAVPLVDLGLSVKWASKNMGSDTESDAGSYYQWGALTGLTACSWDNYFDNPYDESGSIATTNISSARILYFYGSMMHSLSQSNRYVGRPIRAVCDM